MAAGGDGGNCFPVEGYTRNVTIHLFTDLHEPTVLVLKPRVVGYI